MAKAVGEKKVNLPTERQAEQLTGLQAGGISALALLNRGFQVLIDESAHSLEAFYISGGQRGLDLEAETGAGHRAGPLHGAGTVRRSRA